MCTYLQRFSRSSHWRRSCQSCWKKDSNPRGICSILPSKTMCLLISGLWGSPRRGPTMSSYRVSRTQGTAGNYGMSPSWHFAATVCTKSSSFGVLIQTSSARLARGANCSVWALQARSLRASQSSWQSWNSKAQNQSCSKWALWDFRCPPHPTAHSYLCLGCCSSAVLDALPLSRGACSLIWRFVLPILSLMALAGRVALAFAFWWKYEVFKGRDEGQAINHVGARNCRNHSPPTFQSTSQILAGKRRIAWIASLSTSV